MLASASALDVAVLTLAGLCVTGLVTYLVARRTKSGKIDTSEAGKLWEESTLMRAELRQQVASLQQDQAKQALKAAADMAAMRLDYEARLAAVRVSYEGRVERCETTIRELRERIYQLEHPHNDL